jgi:ligand-binding sensor domain-containing protein
MRLFLKASVSAVCILSSVFAFDRFSNISPVLSISDIVIDGTNAWLASSGGLVRINTASGDVQLFNEVRDFPDLRCTALHRDANGALWVGTKKGYLYRKNSNGTNTIFNVYAAAQPEGWTIHCLTSYAQYLIVGSNQGCSIFDFRREKALNALQFGGFNSSNVRAVAVHHDSLFVGCDEGYAVLDISGNRIQTINPYDRSIWKTVSTSSPVTGFADSAGVLNVLYKPTARYNGRTVVADSNRVYADTALVCTVASSINVLKTDGEGNCWIGTSDDFCSVLKNGRLVKHALNTLTTSLVNRVFLDRDGALWCLPQITKNPYPWWLQVNRFAENRWDYFGPQISPFFGAYGDNEDLHGICQDQYGNMWVGTPGGNVKRYDANSHDWNEYLVGGGDWQGGFQRVPWDNREPLPWGKCDAIALDSSGYLWFGVYKGHPGCMICYDSYIINPDSTQIRRFFPLNSPYFMLDVYTINVDKSGRIFFGGYEGKLAYLTHNGKPLEDGVEPHLLGEYSQVRGMVTTENGTTWIATTQGLLYIGPTDAEVTKIIDFPTDITCIAAESDSILWLGTVSRGLLRYEPFGDTLQPSELSIVDVAKGLISNSIKDLCVDRSKGVLWIATSEGLSRYELGHTFQAVTTNKKMLACPNPFSLTRHREVVFYHVAPNSYVSIYDVRGSLISRVSSEAKNITLSPYEWTCTWKPASSVVPGTYIFVSTVTGGKTPGVQKTSVAKLLITP